MGKKGGNSWLTAVKRAFRSPTKDSQKKSSSKRREEFDQVPEEEEEKKREKRRWLFRKPSNINASACAPQNEAKVTSNSPAKTPHELPPEQRHAFAVAAATAAAAEAAVATAQAAVEIIRLARSSNPTSVKQHYAATVIQTVFRGYMARRALVALKGVVKLQALIRGQNVRKQAKMTLKCMQALLRVQARVRDQQARLSNDGGEGRKSMFAECNNLWQSRYLRDIWDRKSMSKDRSCIAEDYWSRHDCPPTLEDLEAALQARKEAASKRERSLGSAFSDQIWDYDSGYDEKEVEERTNWLDKWMATKQWDTSSRGSTDKRDSIKTVEMDTPKQYSYNLATNARKNQYQLSPQYYRTNTPQSGASPRHRSFYISNNCSMLQKPVTPSPSKNKPQHLRSSSPRRLKEEKSYSTANTPNLRSLQRLNTSLCRYSISAKEVTANNAAMPSYMAATESAKARVRSQSAPRQRPSTPDRERERVGLAKKRLSFPVPPEPYLTDNNAPYGYSSSSFSQRLRSPSFKSVQAGYVGLEQHSNQSCYTDSIGGEISPCSTTDLRRWLR